jgi:protein SCO1/2
MKSPAASCGCASRAAAAETIDLRAPEQVRTESDLIRLVEIGRGDSAYTETFLALLDERHAVYQGVGTPVVARMRGALLLALGHRALPTAALPFVIEELETAHEAWLTAVAAHVLRKYPEPLPSFAQPLLSAILYIRHRDDVVRLANYAGHGPGGETTTAIAEVMRTIAWLGRCGMACLSSLEDLIAQNPGPATSAMAANAIKAIREDDQTPPAECCGCGETPRATLGVAAKDISGLRLQDHSGAELSFAEAFHGRPSIVVFFYTRCDNPMKCSLTIAKLARVQALLEARGLAGRIRTAAFTYDPAFDLPDRLRIYGQDRGVRTEAGHRLFRAAEDNDALREHFGLGVGFVGSLVNRHRIELYILDAEGRVAISFEQLRWDEQEVVARAAAMLDGAPG